jgi:hypothetical protein
MSKKRLRKQKKQKSTNKRRYLLIVGIVAAAVLLAILLHTMLGNEPPAIISLGAQPDSVVPSGSCQITCHAIDYDGDNDELSYSWSASGGQISGQGATVNWTAPDSGGFYKVTVTVTDPRGGEAMSQVTITVGSPPVITSLVAPADWIAPSGSVQVTCNATDPDGDELTYEWTATAGNVSGAGSAANWTAPQEVGIYDITVVVKDSHGDSATDSLHISVASEEPPIIAALRITKDRYGHCYLKQSGEKYLVGREQKYDIECIVSNTSMELSHEWSCTSGELSGEGSLITWTAPNSSVEVTVTVVASDIAGNAFSKNIILSVVSCSACTFGC